MTKCRSEFVPLSSPAAVRTTRVEAVACGKPGGSAGGVLEGGRRELRRAVGAALRSRSKPDGTADVLAAVDCGEARGAAGVRSLSGRGGQLAVHRTSLEGGSAAATARAAAACA